MKKISNGQNWFRAAVILLSYAVVTLLLKGGLLNRQYTSLLVPIAVNIMLAVSLNLVTGFLGELTLGHAGFMSIGAYTGALISLNFGDTGVLPAPLAFALALICGGLMAGIFGFIIGVPVLRLRGDYLAIVTLAFGEIIKSVINSLEITNESVTLGYNGIYSSFYLHTKEASERYGIPAREIFSELGKRKVIGGQEDQIIDICYQIMDAKKAAEAKK